MAKRICIIISCILVCVITATVLTAINKEKDDLLKHEGVYTFDYDRYAEKISQFRKTEVNVGSIKNYDDAINKAETLLKTVYGDTVYEHGPLIAYYNSEFDLWLVKTSLEERIEEMFAQGNLILGGDLFCLIEEKTGNVIAYWGEK